MSTGAEPAIRPLRRPPGKLGTYAPWPLVGVAVLLIALIVFTPVLVSKSPHQPAPGILTQAELVVDKIAGVPALHFYVWALGEEIRYDQLHIGLAGSFNWTGSSAMNWSRLNWTVWYNGSEVLSEIIASSANPVALNISAYYVSPGGSAWYVGVIAFYVSVTSPPSGETLFAATDTSGITVVSPLAVSNDTLPMAILLHNAGGGPP